jgi:hypothetical protein
LVSPSVFPVSLVSPLVLPVSWRSPASESESVAQSESTVKKSMIGVYSQKINDRNNHDYDQPMESICTCMAGEQNYNCIVLFT